MSTRINETFESLKKKGEKALIPFIVAGDPSLEFTEKLVLSFVEAGCDIIELGLPFSDPLADGPVIQKAAGRALTAGVRTKDVLSLVSKLREKVSVPLVLLSYYNPIMAYGEEKFITDFAEAGLDGIVIPDLPYEESSALRHLAKGKLDIIPLVAPTSDSKRIRMITDEASGFVYCVAVTGVTGARKELSNQGENLLKKARIETNLPLALGFGVSTAKQAKQASTLADGVIVGSAIVKKIELLEKGESLNSIKGFVAELKSAIK